MFRSLNVAATGMAAQETQLDTIANNLANANTTGYKHQDAHFEDLLYQDTRSSAQNADGTVVPTGSQVGTGVRVVATTRSFSQGSINQTSNPLDLAIEGSGFFAVSKTDGTLAYTRAGSFQLDSQGRITTADGFPLEPPITVPNNSTSVSIAADGTVSVVQPGSTAKNNVGQITLTNFPNPNGLEADGHNLYTPTASSGEPITGSPGTDGRGTLMQGAVEGSNVDVVNEMVALIRAQRAYEINSKVISAADEMLRNATQNQMILRPLLSTLIVAGALSAAAPSNAAAPRQVTIAGTRIHLADVMPGADSSIASLDLGPSPVAGAARLVTRDEIVAALDARQLPVGRDVPQAVRVVRKTKRLAPAEVDALVRGALATKNLRRGISIDAVRIDHPVDVADGWTSVDVQMPRAPKRVGSFATTAVVTFLSAEREPLARIAVPVALAVTAEAAVFDAPRGTALTLVVRRDLIEVRVPATAETDADVGNPLPVQVRLSGHTVRARLVGRDEAIALESPR